MRPSRSTGFWLYCCFLWSHFGIALSNVFLGISALSLPWTVPWSRAELRRLRPALAPLAVMALLLALSAATSLAPSRSAAHLRELANLCALALALLLVRGERQSRVAVTGLLVVATGVAVYGLAQLLAGYGDLDQRIRGPFSHYMTFSGFLLLADYLLLARLLWHPRRGAWGWIALVLINSALVAALTRGAWVALAVVLPPMLLLRAPRLLGPAALLGLVSLLVAPMPLVQRFVSIGDLRDVSNYDRLCMAEAAGFMVWDRPLLGIGPGAVEDLYPLYRNPTCPRQITPHLHNSYLHLAAERGLLSLASYLWLMGAGLTAAWRSYRRAGEPGSSDLLLGAFFALLAFSVAGLFEHNWGDTEVQRTALFLLAIPWTCAAPTAEADES